MRSRWINARMKRVALTIRANQLITGPVRKPRPWPPSHHAVTQPTYLLSWQTTDRPTPGEVLFPSENYRDVARHWFFFWGGLKPPRCRDQEPKASLKCRRCLGSGSGCTSTQRGRGLCPIHRKFLRYFMWNNAFLCTFTQKYQNWQTVWGEGANI